jgi:3-hydroxyisobutyrate dehydrogenase-like beta-hydroxyacid dehydrogenase
MTTKTGSLADGSSAGETIGLIGLGFMGTALTERLLEHGYGVAVWNRTREKAAPLLARGAVWSENPLAACQRVIISLYTSDVVAEVLRRMEAGFQPGQLILDTTTGEPEQTAALGGRLAAGLAELDNSAILEVLRLPERERAS